MTAMIKMEMDAMMNAKLKSEKTIMFINVQPLESHALLLSAEMGRKTDLKSNATMEIQILMISAPIIA